MHKRSFITFIGAIATRPAHALYDPKPAEVLALAPGHWRGNLTYRDYQDPGKMVTLPARLSVALTAPNELALYYVFDDGPGKFVYSYERMTINLAEKEVVWVSGLAKPERNLYQLTLVVVENGQAKFSFERATESGADRFSWIISSTSWQLSKGEVAPAGGERLRNKFEFTRGEA